MIISLKWLNDFVNVKDYIQKPEALADILTRAGLEVENIDNKSKDFEHVVTGLILEKTKHPNADKLSLCRVTTGEGIVHQIVCGAQNHKTNDRVVVALPGAVLPGNFVIKNSVIRGVESGGMLCSDKELGLAKESQGILILPVEAPIGVPFAQYRELDDVTFELKVTPNRADCLSHYGLAREVACLTGKELKVIEPKITTSTESTKEKIALEVKTPDLCPRYVGRYIAGVKVGESPSWIKKRLESVGLSSINNIVDVTNYVMMEMGQPLHAFDANQIAGGKIIVEKADKDEKFEALDGTVLTLTGEELMIRDKERPVAMAGVVGGKNSGVTNTTTDIFLEAAYFNPMAVRKASRTHGVNTDSGYRFSRGVDPENTVRALNRAVELMLEVGSGIAYGEHHDFYPNPIKKHAIHINIETISKRLGYKSDDKKFEDFMRRLGCSIEKIGEKTNSNEFKIVPPTFRFDIENDMDLVEEYARLNGYDLIPESIPELKTSPLPHDPRFLQNYKVSQIIQSQGYHEAKNFAFTGEKIENDFIQNFSNFFETGLAGNEEPVRILNPLSDELNIMRRSLSCGLFRNVAYNFHQGNHVGRLFEIGKTFSTVEHSRLGMIAWGYNQGLWNKNPEHPIVFELKTAIEMLLSDLHIHSIEWRTVDGQENIATFLHQGQNSILCVEGKKVGFIGTLHPVKLDENKIRVPVALAELDLDLLLKGQPRIERFRSISKFPIVHRDLALIMNKDLKSAEILSEITKHSGNYLQSIEVFDLYEGEGLEQGQKSVAFRLSFQDKNATLQDEFINKAIAAVLEVLSQKFSIRVR